MAITNLGMVCIGSVVCGSRCRRRCICFGRIRLLGVSNGRCVSWRLLSLVVDDLLSNTSQFQLDSFSNVHSHWHAHVPQLLHN